MSGFIRASADAIIRAFILPSKSTATAAAAASMLTTLSTVDKAHMGTPFVEGAAGSSVDLKPMNIAHMGQPFVRWIA